jgi:hypothetical protein
MACYLPSPPERILSSSITRRLHFNSTEEWKKNLLTTEQRGLGTHRAVLNAIDARTGKLLYQSGEAMKTCVHFSGLAVSDGRLYAVGHDSNTYCFGLKNSAQDGH